jgi:hypothetical protein
VWHLPMCIAELIACIIFLYIKIFASLKKQACLLAIISYFFGGGEINDWEILIKTLPKNFFLL